MYAVDLENIYEQYFSKVYNYLFLRLLNKEKAEDLTSTVFLKVVDKIDSYNPEKASVYTWIMRITQNALTDYFRTSKATLPIDNYDDPLLGKAEFDEQCRLIKDERRRQLFATLKILDERTLEVLALKYYFELSIREIAVQMEINESTVSSIHVRGLAKLRKTMGESFLAEN